MAFVLKSVSTQRCHVRENQEEEARRSWVVVGLSLVEREWVAQLTRS